MRIVSWLFIFFVISLILIGTEIYKYNPEEDIFNTTNNLNWNFTYTEQMFNNFSEEFNYSIIQTGRVSNIIYKFTDFIGYFFIEGGKFFIEFGFNNPQYNFTFIWKVLRLWIWFLFVSLIIPVIAPLVAIIYLLVIGIIKVFKYLFNNHRDAEVEDKGTRCKESIPVNDKEEGK